MGTKVGLEVADLFSGAEYSQEVHQLETQVTELQAEIQKLRTQGSPKELEEKIETLRTQLTEGGVLDVRLNEIDRNEEQPRQSFSEESISSIARSLEIEGQQQPIILIQREGSRYLLFDGERRWRGAKKLEWQTLRAVIIPEHGELHRRTLLANLHREELNSLDIAEAVIKEIADTNDINPSDIPRTLRTSVRRLERQGSLARVTEIVLETPEKQLQTLLELKLSDVERSIFSILVRLQLNPASVNANIFPMLSLSDDLKGAIRKDGLGGLHALALNRLTAKRLGSTEAVARKKRTKILKQVLKDKLSVAQIRKLVSAEISKQSESVDTNGHKEVNSVVQSLKKLPLKSMEQDELEMLREAMKQALEEIESTLAQ